MSADGDDPGPSVIEALRYNRQVKPLATTTRLASLGVLAAFGSMAFPALRSPPILQLKTRVVTCQKRGVHSQPTSRVAREHGVGCMARGLQCICGYGSAQHHLTSVLCVLDSQSFIHNKTECCACGGTFVARSLLGAVVVLE